VEQGVENLIFDALVEVPYLHQSIVDRSIAILPALSDAQLLRLLKLYSHHEVKGAGLREKLSQMLPIENSFIEKKVITFLEGNGKE
jgi:hypothetical protein